MIGRLILWLIATLFVKIIVTSILGLPLSFLGAVAIAALLWAIHVCCAAANA